MKINSAVSVTRTLLAISVLASCFSNAPRADDTEIYQTVGDGTGQLSRPKVLILFDNSASMTRTVDDQKPRYAPGEAYQATHDNSRIYWSTNGQPPSSDSANYLSTSSNRCAESYDPLADTGYFQSKARRWSADDNAGSWDSLSITDQDPVHVDCLADLVNSNPSNGDNQVDGYPKATVDDEYGAGIPADSDISWGADAYTFYSAHYMDWYYDDSIPLVDRQRIDIAQEVVSNLVNANTSIDFGLGVFNFNGDIANDGGRVVHRVIDNMSSVDRSNLVSMVDGLEGTTWTPLCESSYEMYRYIAGEGVHWGDSKSATDSPDPDLLARDPNDVGSYDSPLANCAYTYVILMTDGEPSRDSSANELIEDLTGETCDGYPDYNDQGDEVTKNCLPKLAEYMANTDLDNDASNGDQFGITYTIGFTTEQDLLRDTAANGKGAYFTADNATQLSAAFRGAILDILSTDASFTSPSVAVDSFTRTQSRNEVFFAMFKPLETVDWPGNIKKLRLTIDDGTASLVDKNGAAAINPANGEIASGASTYWSAGDGGQVEEGGVGGLLAARDPGTRVIKTNTGIDTVLEDFSSDNLDAEAYGFDVSDPADPNAALYDFFGVPGQAELDSVIDWGKGYSISAVDGSITGTRSWILGDMLHSRPLVVNYGALGGRDPNDPDQRIVVGTNGGFLHMFGNDDGEEDWAFFPKELGPALTQRAANATSADHVYGIDASPVLYSNDLNFDGTLDAGAGDKAYLYFGLRRGGSAIYALNISDPDSPADLWRIDQNTAGFSELGQTWSDPVVARIPGYADDNGFPKPVLIFGAGYDTNKDSSELVNLDDSVGRGVFIVDAETGALIWSVTPAANSDTNLQEQDLEHSVPAVVTPLDSNGDGVVDRIYFGDTGGNLWRVDMAGNILPTPDQDTWRIVKMASVNGGTEATDRRLFNAIDVARTYYEGEAFDALLFGSGDRTNPNGIDVDNQFYMIRDRQVAPYFMAEPSTDDCESDDPPVDFRCQLPLDPNDLYDASDNLIESDLEDERVAAALALGAANGWRLDLPAVGEKNLSRSLTIDGKVYFTTFSPDTVENNLCKAEPGTGRLWVLDLVTAGAEIDINDDGSAERSWIIGALIPDAPAPHFGSDGEIRLLLPPGTGGDGSTSNPFETGATLRKPYGSYWYKEEY